MIMKGVGTMHKLVKFSIEVVSLSAVTILLMIPGTNSALYGVIGILLAFGCNLSLIKYSKKEVDYA